MTRFVAHFDGKNICPDEPVKLPMGKPLVVTVEETTAPTASGGIGLGEMFDRIEAESGLVEGPVDWALEHDHYLYGTPRKSGSDGQ